MDIKPSYKDNELSIVLPVFNEADVIKKVVGEILNYALRLVENVEIITVDDGSQDDSLSILNQMSSSLPELKVISHKENIGYGGALRAGIKASSKKWVLLMDSDGQFHINSLEKLWLQRQNYDLLLGFRQKREDAFYRRMMGKLGNSACNLILGRRVCDINCGFKLFKRDLIYPLSLTSSGGIINFEILFKLFKSNPSVKMQQSPVIHYPRKSGKSTGGNPKVIFKIIAEGIKIILQSKK